MKQFNLEEYLTNPNKKVITRDGNSVRILCTDAKGNFPIIALVKTYNGSETVLRLKENGRFYNDTENSSDLFFASEKREVWVNIYKLGDKFIADEITYNTKEEALHNKDAIMDYVGTFKLEFEEE